MNMKQPEVMDQEISDDTLELNIAPNSETEVNESVDRKQQNRF